ncbi:MAG: hypothetical protein K2I52_01550, partial [Muribaculaceae bacterium]|nr:hypothetical protein [Muribaculaceae bacterium]
MKNIFKTLATLCAVITAVSAVTSCNDEVALPSPLIRLSGQTITAPSLESTFNIEVESNCDWQAEIRDGQSGWITITDSRNIGNGEMRLSLKPNETTALREATILVHNENMSASAALVVRQNPSSGDGMVSVGELRLLEGTTGTAFAPGTVTRGVVVSNLQHRNYPDRLIAIEGSALAGNGIAVRTRENLLIGLGEELEVNLDGAGISRDQETGLLILTPGSDDCIIRTEATAIIPTPVEVTLPQLASGDYESMYVKVFGQLSAADITKDYLYEGAAFIDQDNNTVGFTVLPGCSFSENELPAGSGYICGVAGMTDGIASIYPGIESDIVLNATRFDGGFTLPYIFSLMTNTATNDDGRYITTLRHPDDNNLTSAAKTRDDSGVTVQWNVNSNNQYFRFWTDTSGHHNFQLGSWFGLQ